MYRVWSGKNNTIRDSSRLILLHWRVLGYQYEKAPSKYGMQSQQRANRLDQHCSKTTESVLLAVLSVYFRPSIEEKLFCLFGFLERRLSEVVCVDGACERRQALGERA